MGNDSELCNAVRDRLVQATIEKPADTADAVDAVAVSMS
jgi:bacterioferritin-associated ferredoxin